MKDFEILRAAIEQAGIDLVVDNSGDGCEDVVYADLMVQNRYFALIFSHDFAKAFWGKGIEDTMDTKELGWKYHLRLMILEEEPLEYLKQFLK